MPANWYWPVIIFAVFFAGMIWGWGGISYRDDGDESPSVPPELRQGGQSTSRQQGTGSAGGSDTGSGAGSCTGSGTGSATGPGSAPRLG